MFKGKLREESKEVKEEKPKDVPRVATSIPTEPSSILKQKPVEHPIKPMVEIIPSTPETKAIIPVKQDLLLNDIVRPIVSVKQAVDAWNAFVELKSKLITGADIQKIGKDSFVKKSGFRKLAMFFNVTTEIIKEERIPVMGYMDGIDPYGKPEKVYLWKIWVKATAPNGRTEIGIAMASNREWSMSRKLTEKFKEHDVYSTSHTRAKTRAISDLIAGGEVSYEEIEYD